MLGVGGGVESSRLVHAPLLPPLQVLRTVWVGCWESQSMTQEEEGEIWCDANRTGPVVPKATLRAPVSPFQTTVWRYGHRRTGGDLEGNQNRNGGRTKNRERWKKRRRGGEQTDNHRRPQATLIRTQTSTCHIFIFFKVPFCHSCSSIKVHT